MINERPWRRYIVLAALVIIVIIVVAIIDHYLSTGTISVSAGGQQTTITIASADATQAKGKPVLKQAANRLSARLPAGQYIVGAQGHVATITKTVTLKARQSLKITLKLPGVSNPEPIASADAVDLSASDAQLFYINQTLPVLDSIDAQNDITAIGPNVALQSVKWATAGYGVGQDTAGNLYLVNNGSLAPLTLPATNPQIHYAISPGRQIYVAVGKDIYFDSGTGSFQKIYSADQAPAQLAATNDSVAVISPPKGGIQSPILTIVSSSGRVVAQGSVNGSQAVWSPDGREVAIVSFGGGIQIMDTSVKQVASLPSGGTGVVWLNDNTLLYSSGNGIWSYNLNSKNSSLVANLPPDNNINELALDTNKNYIYLTMQDASGNSNIERVGLLGQKPAAISYQLNVFFPDTSVEGCAMDYASFASPTIIVSVSPGLTATCQQAFASVMARDELDQNQVQVKYVSVPGD